MDRRTLLSLLAGASVGLAGCSNQSPDTPTGTPADTSTPPGTDAPTETPTATPTEEPTAEPTETPTATPTEEPTAEPTETPTEDERARLAIEDARTALGEAVDAYEAAARREERADATVVTVDVNRDFSTDRIEEQLTRATDALDRAERLANREQMATVRRLRRAADWLGTVGRAQTEASDAHEAYVRLRDAVYDGEESAAATAASDLDSLIVPVDRQLIAAREAAEPSDVAEVPGLSERLFGQKLAQFDAAVRTFDLLADEGESTASSIAAVETGVTAYRERRRREARNAFRDVKNDLRAASTRLSEPDLSASRVGEEVADLGCVCGALGDAAADLGESAAAWRNGNRRKRDRLLEEAKEALTGCRRRAFNRVPVVEQVRDLDP
jgi:hypothetical protein